MDLGKHSQAELREMLGVQQGHLAVIGLNFKMNTVHSAKQAKKYDSHSINRINEVIDRILEISGELRKHAQMDAKYHSKSTAPTTERTVLVLSLSQYHPVIQRAFLRRLKKQNDIFSNQWANLEKTRISHLRAEAKLRAKRGRFGSKSR